MRSLRILAALPLSIIAAVGACSSSDGPSPGPATLSLESPAALYSGESIELTVRATHPGGRAAANLPLTVEPGTGASVTPAAITTGADGRASFTWTAADRDGPQTITIRNGEASRDFLLPTVPHFTALTVAPADTTLPDFGAETAHRVSGRTTTGRIVDAIDPGIVIVVGDERDLATVPVLVRAGGRHRGNGPGRATLVARKDGLTSDPVTVRMPVARPIIAPPSSPAPVAPGELLTIAGLALDRLPAGAFRLDGIPVEPETRTATMVTLRAPPATGCAGDGHLDVGATGAWLPSPVTFPLDRPDAVVLGVGAVRDLGVASPTTCIQLAAVPDAEYVLVLSDPRSIEAARTSADQDLVVRDELLALRIADRTGASPSNRISGGPRAELPTAAAPLDLVAKPMGASALADDDVALRTTPWRANDRFSIQIDGESLPGTVFRVTNRLAFAVLDRDQTTDVPGRLRRFDEGLAQIASFGVPLVEAAFGPEWPATTEGSGQTLAIYRPIEGAAGLTAIYRRTATPNGLEQNVFIVLNVIGTGELEFDWKTVVHELAHAGQDRHALIRCRDHGDCGFDWFSRRWAVEGGAELIKEEAARQAAGLGRTANLPPASLEISNMYGFRAWWGLEWPHWDWGWGYSSSSFLLRDLLERAVGAGASYEAALAAISRGAFEGWFGLAQSPPHRIGLQARLASWLGDGWNPAAALHRAAVTVALDDRVPASEYQAPLVAPLTSFFREAFRFMSGDGQEMSVTIRGDVFAHYSIADGGRGGSYLIEASTAGLRWSIARVR